MMPPMSIIIDPDPNPQDVAKKQPVNMTRLDSPLARELSDADVAWLMNHVTSRWSFLHGAMGPWRAKMAKWERMAEDNYEDRVGAKDAVNASSVSDIFTDQNDTLGTVAGFFDFHVAQAKDDIFGTRPWLAATPEGRDDNELADVMSKHSQWKFNQSDIEPALKDAIKISSWGGTAFVKVRWHDEVDTFKRRVPVAVDVKTGEPFTTGPARDFVKTAKELQAMGISDEQKTWENRVIEETQSIYANVTAACVDYKDIAFETTAKELDLIYTDVYCRFRMGLLDVMQTYGIPMERKRELMGAMYGYSEEARAHRAETNASLEGINMEENANPQVTLVEGYLRCDPRGTGKLSRIHVIFAPDMNILFAVDYLGVITPGALMAVFPVRIDKIPNRVFGRGYFEKYENPNNAIDRQYNCVTYRNRTGAHVHTAFQPEALKDGGEGRETLLDPTVPYVLAPDKTIDDLIGFKVAPENNNTSVTLLNQTLQMIQMRSGITSAAQGELKGVPSSNTATGTRDLQSRGATIIKDPISQQISDIRDIVDYAVHVLYANQDKDETFTWSDGRESKLLTIEASKVLGLRSHVTLTLVQAQNQAKLQSAMTAIDVVTKYILVPEVDKMAARSAFVQALAAVGFNNADDIIRKAAVTPEAILALCPPEMAPAVQAAFVQAGIMAPPASPQETPQEVPGAPSPTPNPAPVTNPAEM